MHVEGSGHGIIWEAEKTHENLQSVWPTSGRYVNQGLPEYTTRSRGSLWEQMQNVLMWKQVVLKSNRCSLKSYTLSATAGRLLYLISRWVTKRTRFSSVIRVMASRADRKAHFRAAAGLRVWHTHAHSHTHTNAVKTNVSKQRRDYGGEAGATASRTGDKGCRNHSQEMSLHLKINQ